MFYSVSPGFSVALDSGFSVALDSAIGLILRLTCRRASESCYAIFMMHDNNGRASIYIGAHRCAGGQFVTRSWIILFLAKQAPYNVFAIAIKLYHISSYLITPRGRGLPTMSRAPFCTSVSFPWTARDSSSTKSLFYALGQRQQKKLCFCKNKKYSTFGPSVDSSNSTVSRLWSIHVLDISSNVSFAKSGMSR